MRFTGFVVSGLERPLRASRRDSQTHSCQRRRQIPGSSRGGRARYLWRASVDGVPDGVPDGMELQWQPLEGQIEVPLLPVSMADGGDVLFPGTTENLMVTDKPAVQAAMAENPPLLGHLFVDAWGVEAKVGTLALLMSSQFPADDQPAECTIVGVGRFVVREIYPGSPRRALIEIFSDDPPEAVDPSAGEKPVEELETELIQQVMDLMRLNFKIADDPGMEQIMHSSEQNMRSFIEQSTDEGALEQVRARTGFSQPTRGAEFLGFLACNMLDFPFMERRALLESRNTRERLVRAVESVTPAVKELAARAAVEDALGK